MKAHLFHRGGLCMWMFRPARESSATPPGQVFRRACPLTGSWWTTTAAGAHPAPRHGHDEVSDHGLWQADHHERGRGSKRNGLPE